MSTPLTREEKESLLLIIEIIYGPDPTLQMQVDSFNERTVEVVEEALAVLTQCNDNIKALVSSLANAGSGLTKGWLRWSLKGMSYGLKNDHIRFNEAACRNVIALSRKSHIQMTL